MLLNRLIQEQDVFCVWDDRGLRTGNIFTSFRNIFFTVFLAFCTHVTSRFSTSSSTDHGGLDCAAPPTRAGASLMVDYRKVGLPHSGRHASPSWRYRETNKCMCKIQSHFTAYSQNSECEDVCLTHWTCAHIQWCSRSCGGAGSHRKEAERPASHMRSGTPQKTAATGRCHYY